MRICAKVSKKNPQISALDEVMGKLILKLMLWGSGENSSHEFDHWVKLCENIFLLKNGAVRLGKNYSPGVCN